MADPTSGDDGDDADSAPPRTVRGKRANSFDALLLEVAAAPSPPTAPWELMEQTRFRVYERIGAGGGGQVYRAFDTQLDRQVALKFLNGGPDQTAALVKEARTQARVQHPNVCPVYEVIETLGQPYLVMQLIEGPTLTTGAREMSLRQKVDTMRQVAEAMAAAHALGIIHRDLKPNNILLQRNKETNELHPFVTDFGLARELDKTFTHGVVGTPHFMSPEQARGDSTEVGVSADIWAIGATLFTLLEGRPPFDGGSMMSILDNVLRAPPAPLDGDVPPELKAIILRCLEKDPTRRFASAGELADELARFVRGERVLTRPPGPLARLGAALQRRGRPLGVALAALLTAGAAALAIEGLRRPPPSTWRPEIRERPPLYEENADPVMISPDGKQQLYASNRDGGWRIYLEPIDGPGVGRALVNVAAYASWAPDGKSIYYTDEANDTTEVKTLALTEGATPQPVVVASQAIACGSRLFYLQGEDAGCTRCERIVMRTIGQTDDVELISRPVNSLSDLSCEPTGQRIAYTHRDKNGDRRIAWLDINDKRQHLLPSPVGDATQPHFHPDGRTILSRGLRGARHTLWEQSLDGSMTRELTAGIHDSGPSLSPDGKRLFYNVELPGTALVEHPLDGRPPRRISLAAWNNRIVVNPDGTELLGTRTIAGWRFVSTIAVADGTTRDLAIGQSRPVYGSDGATVYYGTGGEPPALVAIARTGGAPRLLAYLPLLLRDLWAGKDGVHLELGDGGQIAYLQPYDGGPGRREGDDQTNALWPLADGWRLAYGHGTARVLPPVGSAQSPRSLPAANDPRPTTDGRGVIWIDRTNVVYLDVASGETKRIPTSSTDLESAAMRDAKGPLYTLDDRTLKRRMEVVNYAELPRP